MEKISIVVPVYNVENYLRKCLDSILNQTYKNIEIILIDDGSKDSSGNICDEYALKSEKIKVIHKENAGLSATRNLGIEVSTGDYIAFIDSDDYITEDYCEMLYNTLKETNADIACGAYKVVRTDESVIIDSSVDSGLSQNEVVEYEGIEIMREFLCQKTFKNFVWNKLFKKSVVCSFQVGINYEDIVFGFNVLSTINKVTYINRNCYFYLKRNSSITATMTEKNLQDFGKAIYDRYDLISSKYPELSSYNMYAFLESSLALSIKYVISKRMFKEVEKYVFKFITIILEYTASNEKEFFVLLNDYQKLCIYLMRYNTELYFNFLDERQKLKVQGKLK